MRSPRGRSTPRHQHDQCNGAHLLYAELNNPTTRHVCRVRSPPRYQNDQCNEGNLEDHSFEQEDHFRTTKLRQAFFQKARKLRRSGPSHFNRFADSGRPPRIALSIRVARRESLCRFASPDPNRSVDSRRPTRIALSIRGARRESLCRFASPDANRSVDSRRPTRIALPIRFARLESSCRFGPPGSNRTGRLESLG